MKKPTKDQIDTAILDRIEENPGISIFGAIEPFLTERSESPLRTRVRQLAQAGEIKIVATRHTYELYRVDDANGDAL